MDDVSGEKPKPGVQRLPMIGDDVFCVLSSGPRANQARPAKIVYIWGKEMVDLVVFVDSSNDGSDSPVSWQTSVPYSADGGFRTFHYPEDRAGPAGKAHHWFPEVETRS